MKLSRRIDMLGSALTVLIAAFALATAVRTVRAHRSERARPVAVEAERPRPRPGIEEVQEWRVFAAGGHRMGSDTAPVVIMEFSDFDCPYCQRLAQVLHTVQTRHPRDVAIVFLQYPLVNAHTNAMGAALASECAAAQDRFAAYHDLLFERSVGIGRLGWTRLADRAGVRDTAAFSRCVSDSTYASVVEGNIEAGRRLGVRGTPTVLVNRWRIRSAPTDSVLENLIRSEMDRPASTR